MAWLDAARFSLPLWKAAPPTMQAVSNTSLPSTLSSKPVASLAHELPRARSTDCCTLPRDCHPPFAWSLQSLEQSPQALQKCPEAFGKPLNITSSFGWKTADFQHSLPGPWEGPGGQAVPKVAACRAHPPWRRRPCAPPQDTPVRYTTAQNPGFL